MEPGLFYTGYLTKQLNKFEKEKQRLQALLKKVLPTKKAWKFTLAKHFRVPITKIVLDRDYDQDEASSHDYDARIKFEPGAEMRVSWHSLTWGPGSLSPGEEKLKEREKAACKKACSIRDLMENSELNKFVSRCRVTFGRKTFTEVELNLVMVDWLRLRAPHTCPV